MLRWCGMAGMLGGVGLVVAPALFVATRTPLDAYQSRWRWTMTALLVLLLAGAVGVAARQVRHAWAWILLFGPALALIAWGIVLFNVGFANAEATTDQASQAALGLGFVLLVAGTALARGLTPTGRLLFGVGVAALVLQQALGDVPVLRTAALLVAATGWMRIGFALWSQSNSPTTG